MRLERLVVSCINLGTCYDSVAPSALKYGSFDDGLARAANPHLEMSEIRSA